MGVIDLKIMLVFFKATYYLLMLGSCSKRQMKKKGLQGEGFVQFEDPS